MFILTSADNYCTSENGTKYSDGEYWTEGCISNVCQCDGGQCKAVPYVIECPEQIVPELNCPEAISVPGQCCLDLTPCYNKGKTTQVPITGHYCTSQNGTKFYNGEHWKEICNEYECHCKGGECVPHVTFIEDCPEIFRPELRCPEAIQVPGECCLDLTPCQKEGELTYLFVGNQSLCFHIMI